MEILIKKIKNISIYFFIFFLNTNIFGMQSSSHEVNDNSLMKCFFKNNFSVEYKLNDDQDDNLLSYIDIFKKNLSQEHHEISYDNNIIFIKGSKNFMFYIDDNNYFNILSKSLNNFLKNNENNKIDKICVNYLFFVNSIIEEYFIKINKNNITIYFLNNWRNFFYLCIIENINDKLFSSLTRIFKKELLKSYQSVSKEDFILPIDEFLDISKIETLIFINYLTKINNKFLSEKRKNIKYETIINILNNYLSELLNKCLNFPKSL
jgi:hypothetical protein